MKNGSIFTPEKIVSIVAKLVSPYITPETTIIDFGAGYGAFEEVFQGIECGKLIATEFDSFSCDYLKKNFPNVDVRYENSLIDIHPGKYGDSRIAVIGNPPYNDVTSQYRKGQKGSEVADETVHARDMGISFLKLYAEIKADVICVLHPLSYLIKKTNFLSTKQFRENYRLTDAVIFSSSEFESIDKANISFPVVAALYLRDSEGMSYDYISDFSFHILGSSKTYRLANFKTIDGVIRKYPTKDKNDSDLQFYTIRDINALKRNKTFLVGHCNNGVEVDMDQLYLYAWLDYFKNNFEPEDYYLYGNLSPLLPNDYNSTRFKDELEKYIVNENPVVKSFAESTKSPLLSKIGQKYDKKYLKSLVDSIC